MPIEVWEKKCYCVIYYNFRHARSLWINHYDCERPVINCGSHLPLALWPWQTWRLESIGARLGVHYSPETKYTWRIHDWILYDTTRDSVEMRTSTRVNVYTITHLAHVYKIADWAIVGRNKFIHRMTVFHIYASCFCRHLVGKNSWKCLSLW